MNPDTLNIFVIVCNSIASAFLVFFAGIFAAALYARGDHALCCVIMTRFTRSRVPQTFNVLSWIVLLIDLFVLIYPQIKFQSFPITMCLHFVTLCLSRLPALFARFGK